MQGRTSYRATCFALLRVGREEAVTLSVSTSADLLDSVAML